MGGGIDADPVAREHRIAFHHDLAPQDGADAEQQFPMLNGFDHIVIRPQLEAEDTVHVFAPCRQHDDGDAHRAGVAFEFAADREPSIFGSMRSSRMRSGLRERARSNPSLPSAA